MKLQKFALAATVLAASMACAGAQAASPWAATHTLAQDTSAAVVKDAMLPGEKIHVALALNIHDKAGLDALVKALSAGKAAHLTPAQFLAHYAPTAAETQAVVDHLRQSGFTNVQVSRNRMVVTADGTAATAKVAFNTEMRHVTVNGKDAYANVTDVQVPAHLGGIVSAVLGLQTMNHSQTTMRKLSVAQSAKNGGNRLTHDASDFSTLYGADSLPPASGATLGIVTVGSLYMMLNDLNSLATMKGWPAPNTQVEMPAGDASEYTTQADEWNMDSQASLGAAGGQLKQMTFYDVPDFSDASLESAYNAAITDGNVQAISVSIGECESYARLTGYEASADILFEIGIAQGQTFAFATGDQGAWVCGEQNNGVLYPAASPWVMAVGGTTLVTGNNPTVYVDEKAWSCTSRAACVEDGGTGGGMSITEPLPSWQTGLVGKNGKSKWRNIPDVSFDADPYTGLNLFEAGAYQGPIGGTSLSTPIFSGLWARIQSANGNSLGFPGMGLYGMHATDAGVFHDVTFGTNDGWKATPGWDDVTGFGSFDASLLNTFIEQNPSAFGH